MHNRRSGESGTARERKRRVSRYVPVAGVLGGVGMAIFLILTVMKDCGYYLYLPFCHHEQLRTGALAVALLVLISAAAVWACGRWGHRGLISVCAVLLSGFIACVSILDLAFTASDSRVFEFVSPDGAHHLVVDEQAMLLAGWGDIYEVICPGIMVRVGGYTTDDGFRPFSAAHYSFSWGETGFSLRYDFGAGPFGDDDGYHTIEIPYACT